jgi:tRNA pseudouridine55 synthase
VNIAAGDFILPVDKPVGPTSHDVVALARRALRTKRVGHTGTLDPFASGLLLLCVGRSTRLAEYLSAFDKSYVATARLGVCTDTLDREGTVVCEGESPESVHEADVASALNGFVGVIDQVPPQFSAKKVDGEAMHRKARRGEHVELPPVSVTVHSVDVVSWAPPDVTFTVRCSTGTYIRAIARDLGEKLGTGAHLTDLRRTMVGTFDVTHAIRVEDMDDPDFVARLRVPPIDAVSHLPVVTLDSEEARRLLHGQRVRIAAESGARPANMVPVGEGRASSPEGTLVMERVAVVRGETLLAIADLDDGLLRPRKVFPA